MPTLYEAPVSDNYRVIVDYSPIYECALAVGAYTWPDIADKLDRSPDEWRTMTGAISPELRTAVQLAGAVHTWRSLLYLAHRCPTLRNASPDSHVEVFVNWLKALGGEVKHLAAPYLGERYEGPVRRAMQGDEGAKASLVQAFADDALMGPNLAYLCDVDPQDLIEHLLCLLLDWKEQVFHHADGMFEALSNDCAETRNKTKTMSPQDLVHLVTRGSDLQPEARVDTLWLIPQVSYRPYTIRNRLPGCAIYYYPLDDAWLPSERDHRITSQIAAVQKALGDKHRVRVLKLLRGSDGTVGEIAAQLEMPKSTVHHHLTLLRSAGLIHVHAGVYRLNLEAVKGVHHALWDYLHITAEE